MKCTSCGSGEHHFTICVPNIKGKTNMLQVDSESDEREGSGDDRPYTKLDDEVSRWELDDWIMDDGSEGRLYYQRCPKTGMAFERFLGHTRSRRVAHPRVLLGSRKVTLLESEKTEVGGIEALVLYDKGSDITLVSSAFVQKQGIKGKPAWVQGRSLCWNRKR